LSSATNVVDIFSFMRYILWYCSI